MEEAEASARVVRLIEWDPDLAQDLGEEDTRAARAELLARAVTIEWKSHRGSWAPRDPRAYFGLLVLEGRLLREVKLPRGGSAELLGVGDLLRPWDVDGAEFLPIETTVEWAVLSEVTVALLDGEFVRRAARWPTIVSRLSGRGVFRAKGATLNQAISHMRHVESRLLLLFWHFADRWGKVGPDAISIDLPLTHELLGRFVGATRPSVTTALSHLAERELLVREGTVWRVSHESADQLRRTFAGGQVGGRIG